VFEVAEGATKGLIKDAIETLFDVDVVRVNVLNVPAKRSRRWRNRRVQVRRPSYKKAIVTLSPGDTIDVFEGVR
jgi:large subunit ribosomal protein L23